MKLFSLLFFIYLTISALGQTIEDIQWSSRGNSFFNIENNSVVEYLLPSFQKKVLVDSIQLIPKGQGKALRIRSFSISDDGKKVLIYTNSKKVWRRDTRGDYWIYETA